MHQDLERLIELALADGVVTDKERAVLHRKAAELGVDPDELDLVVDGRLHQASKVVNSAVPTKEGSTRKCPSCGAPSLSFVVTCSHCGHEFRDIDTVSSVKKLYEEFRAMEEAVQARPATKIEQWLGRSSVADNQVLIERQIRILTAFPVPNTKEDLLEFLAIGASEASKKVPWNMRVATIPEYQIQQAWLAKCRQVIMKARMSMKDDQQLLAEVERYASQLGIA